MRDQKANVADALVIWNKYGHLYVQTSSRATPLHQAVHEGLGTLSDLCLESTNQEGFVTLETRHALQTQKRMCFSRLQSLETMH